MPAMRVPGPMPENRKLLIEAVMHHQQGRIAEAGQLYRKVLESDPRHPDALALLGLTEHQSGRDDVARSLIEKALMIKPGEAAYLVNLSQVHRVSGRLKDAEQCLRRAIQSQPRLAEAHSNLASVLRLQKRLDEAEAAAKQALGINPQFGSAMLNMGTVLEDRGEYVKALEWFMRALKHGSGRADTLMNIGDALCCLGRWDEGRTALEQAVAAAPENALAHWNLSLAYLVQGDLARGFAENEWRLRHRSSDAGRFTQPMWKGEELNGRSILLHMEQGFGDAVQFVRYAPMVAGRGGKVLVDVQPHLVDLMRSVEGVHQVIPRGQDLPPFDVHAPLMSLGQIFGTTLATIPAKVPYLHAPPERVEAWRAKIPAEPGVRKIGLVWAGNPTHRNDRNRSIPLSELSPLAGVPNVKWYSLQFGPAAGQARPPGLELTVLTNEARDFSDTAAMMMHLDLVITVDTAAAHVAGALGRPVWILVPAVPDWRWLLNRSDSPWYPTAKVFRQSQPAGWSEVIARVAKELS